VNEGTIKKYKSGLADEIEPAISELIERAEQGLASLERKEALLQTKVTGFSFFGYSACLHCHSIRSTILKLERPPLELVLFRNSKPVDCKH
jgi:hypothetical protein